MKNFDEAEKYYLKAIEVDESESTNYRNLGNLYRQKNQPEKGEHFLLKAIEKNP